MLNYRLNYRYQSVCCRSFVGVDRECQDDQIVEKMSPHSRDFSHELGDKYTHAAS